MKVIISLVDQRHQINVYTPDLAGETISVKTNRTVSPPLHTLGERGNKKYILT